MVVVHITNGLFRGGVGSVIQNLLIEQEKLGLKTAIVTPDSPAILNKWFHEHNLKTQAFFVERKKRRFLTIRGCLSKQNYKKIKNVYQNEKIIFHYHNAISIGLISKLVQKEIKFCTLHGELYITKRFSKQISIRTLKRFVKKGGTLIGCCQHISKYYQKILKTQVKYVLNGIPNALPVDKKYIVQNDKCHLGFVGRIDELKGWRYLADAFLSLPEEKRTMIDLTFVGSVGATDKEDFDRVIKENEDIFYVGSVENASSTIFPFLDFLVLPSRTEGMPMVLLEAMQAECLCLTTLVGGIGELIKDGETGLVITRDARDIKEKIEKILNNDKLTSEMRLQAKLEIEANATSEIMTQKYIQIYKDSVIE